MKFIFFGDSFTWGGYGGNFVSAIAQKRTEHQIINAGVSGNTVVNLLRRLDDDVLAQEPDGVFVMVGGNDAISYYQPETRPYYKKSQALPDGIVTPELFTQTYRELLTRLQLAFIQTWVGLAPTEHSPEVVEGKTHYNNLAADVARSLNIPTLDLMTALTPDHIPQRPPIDLKFIDTIGRRSASGWNDFEAERQKHGFTYTFDGLHLMPDAAETVADLILDFIGI
jgi:lysophospholipase L1-like esterase